jgi:hypothetical protein
MDIHGVLNKAERGRRMFGMIAIGLFVIEITLSHSAIFTASERISIFFIEGAVHEGVP